MPVRRTRTLDETPEVEEVKAAPRRRRSRSEDDDTVFVEESEDARPARSSRVRSGWKAANEISRSKSSGSSQGFVEDFRPDGEAQLVAFLSDDPISYLQHWVERPGKKGFVCLEEDCPLCDAGIPARAKHAFSVVSILDGQPKVLLYQVSNRVLTQLQDHNENPKTGPLTRMFYSIHRTGKAQQTVHHISVVKPRDLEEDWDITEEEVEEILDGMSPAGPDAIYETPKQELKDIAAAL